MTEVSIIATCSKKPGLIVTNSELEEKLGLKSGIIERLTGIQRRHYIGKGESLQMLAADACAEAIEDSNIDPANLDMMIYYSEVPPTILENNRLNKLYYEVSAHIQYLLNKKGLTIKCECINIGGSCVPPSAWSTGCRGRFRR